MMYTKGFRQYLFRTDFCVLASSIFKYTPRNSDSNLVCAAQEAMSLGCPAGTKAKIQSDLKALVSRIVALDKETRAAAEAASAKRKKPQVHTYKGCTIEELDEESDDEHAPSKKAAAAVQECIKFAERTIHRAPKEQAIKNEEFLCAPFPCVFMLA